MYLWQASGWPALTWDANAVTAPLAQARLAQGRMLGLAGGLGMMDLAQLQLAGWTQEALATAQIEGEQLQVNSIRASAARRLGLADASAVARDPRTEATLDVLQAAVAGWDRALTQQDLFGWHAALFPTGRSGVTRIATGTWRTHGEPMQIVTPRLGRPDLVHYEAPPSVDVPAQMRALLEWFNVHSRVPEIDGLVRAAVVHLWFEAIHPFGDGNGRIGRAVAELALAHGRYWAQVNTQHPGLSASQRKALARLLEAEPEGFAAGMSTEKYVNLTGVSRATAYRELTQLTELGLLERTGVGRGTRYRLKDSRPTLEFDEFMPARW